jgi:hypothetical protein
MMRRPGDSSQATVFGSMVQEPRGVAGRCVWWERVAFGPPSTRQPVSEAPVG